MSEKEKDTISASVKDALAKMSETLRGVSEKEKAWYEWRNEQDTFTLTPVNAFHAGYGEGYAAASNELTRTREALERARRVIEHYEETDENRLRWEFIERITKEIDHWTELEKAEIHPRTRQALADQTESGTDTPDEALGGK